MRIDIVTIFPGYFAPLRMSLIGKAADRGDIEFGVHDLRSWTRDIHHTVDDTPYGGGPGMVMKPTPWGEALDTLLPPSPATSSPSPATSSPSPATSSPSPATSSPATSSPATSASATSSPTSASIPTHPTSPANPTNPASPVGLATPNPTTASDLTRAAGPASHTRLVVPSPSGRPFTQDMAVRYSRVPHLVFACGRYEGIDARVVDEARTRVPVDEVSIGDYVLAGGEPAVLVMIEAICRLLPGVLGNAESAADDSFGGGDEDGGMTGLLEGPVYTRPRVWRDREVPPVLLSGDHGAVARWRRDEALRRTVNNRPDLIAQVGHLDSRDKQVLSDAGFPVHREDMAH